MTPGRMYLVLCVLGAALPLFEFARFLADHGADPGRFPSDLFASHVSALFALDVFVLGVVLLVFVFAEGRRLAIGRLWLYGLASVAVGVSFGLPLFLCARHRALERERGMAG